MVDDLVFEQRDQGEGALRVPGEPEGVPGVAADLGGLGEFREGGGDACAHVGSGEGQCEGGRHGAGTVHSVAVLGVAGVELGEVRGEPGVAGVGHGEDAGPYAGGVVEVVRVVVAGGGRTQAGGEVAEACADGDAGAEGQDGGLDLGGAVRRRGDFAGQGVPGEVDRGSGAAFSAEVSQGGVVTGTEDGFRGEGCPFRVVGGAQAEGFGGLVQGDGHGEGRRGVLFGEGVEFPGEAAGPVRHAGGSVAGGGPAGGVACGQAEQEALDSASLGVDGLGFAFGLCVPTRTTRAAFAVGCRWPRWGMPAVGGCGVDRLC